MAREYRVISALAGTGVPVPRVDAFCDDPDVNGAPFYVMELVVGRILRTPEDMSVLTPDDARRCSNELIDVLARLHGVDYEAVGLGEFGRPDGFLGRNVARWGKQWAANKTRDVPEIDELARRLDAALPESGPPAIVHGDYRLDNTMLAPDDAGRIVAVLDWEMSTLGDPLTDLGLFLVYWGADTGPAVGSSQGIVATEGFLSKDEIVARYAAQSGRSVDHLDFYVVFATYKLAVILEGINARFLMGKTLGDGFGEMGEMVVQLARSGLEIADAAPDPALHGRG
jgi:aminoglycoside phosphotransferase (APT) family kinase protein